MIKIKATQSVQFWKQHRCAGCGALFRYLVKREGTATAFSKETAQERVRAQLERKIAESIEQRPCPHCGIYQPDMTAPRRRKVIGRLWVVVWITLAVFALSALADAAGVPGMTPVVVFIVGLCAAWQAWTAWRDFNGNPAKNLRAAQKAVAKGALRLDAPGVVAGPSSGSQWQGPGRGILALLAAGVLVIALAEAVRTVAGWPANENFYPAVVGPGDSARFRFKDEITSVKGYWRAQPQIRVKNAGELGLSSDEIAGTANDSTWGGTISVKPSEKDSTSLVWIKFTMPGDAAVANKLARLQFDLPAEFPQMVDATSYHTVQQDFSEAADLRLAAPGAGGTYLDLWYGGLAASFILLAFATRSLCRWVLREKTSTQTGLFPVERAAGPAVPPPVPPRG